MKSTPTRTTRRPGAEFFSAFSANNTNAIELTGFVKTGGVLTKRISLDGAGKVVSDGSACVMSDGQAWRVRVSGILQFAEMIEHLPSSAAIALGALREYLPRRLKVTTKARLANGAPHANTIARTNNSIAYRPGAPAFLLLDFDRKGMPAAVAAELQRRGGFWPALCSVLPVLRGAAHVTRLSTSSGLIRDDTGEQLSGSGGMHVFLIASDGTDSERFLHTLHDRCWLAGLGWMTIGAGGQLLERSIVDRMVGRPERLVFEGPPILKKPLKQDRASRKPIAHEGDVLDSRAACPDVTMAEHTTLETLKAKEKERLAPQAARVRAAFIDAQAKRLAERTGLSEQLAKHNVRQQCEGILLPSVALPFDDDELTGCTVADVLADPARFEGRTLADPVEGEDYVQ